MHRPFSFLIHEVAQKRIYDTVVLVFFPNQNLVHYFMFHHFVLSTDLMGARGVPEQKSALKFSPVVKWKFTFVRVVFMNYNIYFRWVCNTQTQILGMKLYGIFITHFEAIKTGNSGFLIFIICSLEKRIISSVFHIMRFDYTVLMISLIS